MTLEERVTNLEIKLSFTEDLLEELNQTIYKQQQIIEILNKEIRALKLNAETNGASGSKNLRDEIPPHY